jgi:hypothetical protein
MSGETLAMRPAPRSLEQLQWAVLRSWTIDGLHVLCRGMTENWDAPHEARLSAVANGARADDSALTRAWCQWYYATTEPRPARRESLLLVWSDLVWCDQHDEQPPPWMAMQPHAHTRAQSLVDAGAPRPYRRAFCRLQTDRTCLLCRHQRLLRLRKPHAFLTSLRWPVPSRVHCRFKGLFSGPCELELRHANSQTNGAASVSNGQGV